MNKTVPRLLRVGLSLKTFCREDCLGRKGNWLSFQAFIMKIRLLLIGVHWQGWLRYVIMLFVGSPRLAWFY